MLRLDGTIPEVAGQIAVFRENGDTASSSPPTASDRQLCQRSRAGAYSHGLLDLWRRSRWGEEGGLGAMVKRAEQQRANKIIADGLGPVTRRIFYIDTIVVLLPEKLQKRDLVGLRRLNREHENWGRVLVKDTMAFKKAS